MRRLLLPLLLPLVLLGVSFWKAGVISRYYEVRELERKVTIAQARLDEARAVAWEYQGYVNEFADLTGLRLQESEIMVTRSEVNAQLADLVDAITKELKSERYTTDEEAYLLLVGVTPGERQLLDPFLWIDFQVHLEGRFFALPQFMDRVSHLAKEKNCSVSIGELKMQPLQQEGGRGDLAITLPLRAYFLAR